MKTSQIHKPYRVFSAFLALILLLSFLTVPVFAEPDDTPTEPETQAVEAPVSETPESEPAAAEPVAEQPSEPIAEQPTEPVAELSAEPVAELPAEPPSENSAESVPEEPMKQKPEATEPRSMFRFTPDGNLTLIDDFEYVGMDADGNVLSKQFITVQSRDGSYFYIIIDRTGNGQNVYFLNQVDLADLKSLANNEKQIIPDSGCTCTTHCTVGNIDTSCPVCAKNMTECAAVDISDGETDNSETKAPESGNPDKSAKPSEKQGMNPILALALTVIILGGILIIVFKGRGKRTGRKGTRRFRQQDFDFDDEDDDEEELEAEAAQPKRTIHSALQSPGTAPDIGENDGEDDDYEDETDLI